MAIWKKRNSHETSIDFESMEEILEEILETFEEDDLDFSNPLKVGFSISLDSSGCLKIDEFGILKSDEKKHCPSEPLIDLIESDSEMMVAFETNSLSPDEINIKILDYCTILSDSRTNRIIKKVYFPCRVKESTAKTRYNNGILEIRIRKKLKTTKAKN
jgi:HSP20 family molecular chaperone IbpA